MPTLRTKLRRVSAMMLLPLPAGGGDRPQRRAEHVRRPAHLLHRPERYPRVRGFERREVAADHHAFLRAGVAERPGRTADVDEEEVPLRVGALAPELVEHFHGEGAHVGVALA